MFTANAKIELGGGRELAKLVVNKINFYGLVLITIGPFTLAQQDNRQSAGFPRRVFCSFFEGGFKFSAPEITFTAQVPQIPQILAPASLPSASQRGQAWVTAEHALNSPT